MLFGWEVILEWSAALRAIRRDVQPRGHRGGIYPLMRGALCVFVRDLIVSGVLTDMMRGRPAVYATFSSYDEVAHHSGLERADTLEALRKLDDHFGQIELRPATRRGRTRSSSSPTTARRRARPSSSATATGSTSWSSARSRGRRRRDRRRRRAKLDGRQRDRRGHRARRQKKPKNDVSDRDVVVLGSGNLGLIYLMEERRRLTLEEINQRHPELIPALRAHPHVGWLLVRSSEHGAVALGANGTHYLAQGRVEGEDPLAHFSPHAPQHLLRTDGFEHVGDIMVGSFYDPDPRRRLRLRRADLASTAASAASRPGRSSSTPPSSRSRKDRSSAPPASTASSPAGGNSSRGRRARRCRRRRRRALPSNRSVPRGRHDLRTPQFHRPTPILRREPRWMRHWHTTTTHRQVRRQF